VLFAYAEDVGEIGAVLDNYQPSTITRLLARDGQEIGAFAIQRRLVIPYEQISPILRQAIIATEDGDFENHFGLNPTRIVVAVARGLLPGQAMTGASTITQQVARLLFLQDEYMSSGVFARRGLRGVERKIKEWMLALQIERRYTKREIFAFYANQSNLGPGIYGVEAAARSYFNRSAGDLTLDEAATIAAVFQTPARLSPFINPDQTLARRNNVVLRRMIAESFISEADARDAADQPIALRGTRRPSQSIAPYFAEEIRKDLVSIYGSEVLYEGGLEVQTTLDSRLQKAANAAMNTGLRRIDKLWNGYRRPTRNVLDEGETISAFSMPRWIAPVDVGDVVPAVVIFVPERGTPATTLVRIGTDEIDLPTDSFRWTSRTDPNDLFVVGDLIEVAVEELDDAYRPVRIRLEQAPVIQGALLALDNSSGHILAMVGGANFELSEFNRAVQAERQMGSLFKPIVYTAAIDRGFTPVSIFIDEPISVEIAEDQPLYEPENYDLEYEGAITMRRALEDSRNIPAVKAMMEIGADVIVDYAVRFGFPDTYQPFLSLALGAAESTLLEVTSAYSAFPNRGIRMEPYAVISITDRDGTPIEERSPQPQEVLRADTAFVMTNLLRGVVQNGTGRAAAALDWPLGGKTGTMDDYTDAWFVGFDPDITVGVWVGHDEKRTIGDPATGASTALPIWNDFMQVYVDTYGDRSRPPGFEPPDNIVFVRSAPGVIDAFVNGTQPQAPISTVNDFD
jgi:penicillin-binding protein 1A